MKKKIVLFSFFAIVSVSVACAQDITGHWTGKSMERDVAYDFKVQGDSLTGKDTHPDGSVSDISNGIIKADSLAFDVMTPRGGLTHVTGKAKGNLITLSYSNGHTLVLKKTEEK